MNLPHLPARVVVACLLAPAVLPAAVLAAPATTASRQCTSIVTAPTAFVMLGKSTVIGLPSPVSRIIVSGPAGPAARTDLPVPAGAEARSAAAAMAPPAQMATGSKAADHGGVAEMDVQLLSPTDLFFRGRRAGAMNVILQDNKGVCYLRDIVVSIDPAAVQAKLDELMPEERSIRVRSAENSIILTGTVSDALKLDEVLRVAGAYGDGKRVVNLLRVTAPQQVMLEVKIAEVSKTLLDKFNIDFARLFTSADGMTSRVISGIFGGGPALLGQFAGNFAGGAVNGSAAATVGGAQGGASAALATRGRGATLFGIDAQKKDGLLRILAEPNIMAISGQSASFLSGGRIFIPVAQARDTGGTTITLEEKEFGVGLKFSPTVLDGSRVNLKLVSEVSELSQTGSPFTTVGGVTSVLPSITTRRVDTSVQLNDGQSFAIAGLISNNVTETLSRFPGLGELPVIGALFRSTEFQKDQTELIFIVTPRLVKPLAAAPVLPTTSHTEPSRAGVLLMGASEGPAQPGQPDTLRK